MSEQPGAADPVTPAETLARFIFSSSHFSRENQRVKHNAFMPAPDNKTSVFRKRGLEERGVWNIGHEVAKQRDQPLHARADISAGMVTNTKLTIAVAEPPPGHCNIEGWPAEKSAQKLLAIELADAAMLILSST